MLFTNLITLSATVAVAAAAAIAPSPIQALVERSTKDPVQLAQLDKRGPESVHFLNCAGSGGRFSSLIVYCADDSNCRWQPASQNACVKSSTRAYNYERNSDACTFGSGVQLTWGMSTSAGSQPNYSVVGQASNGFRSFTLYKDDRNNFYTTGDGVTCQSWYYGL